MTFTWCMVFWAFLCIRRDLPPTGAVNYNYFTTMPFFLFLFVMSVVVPTASVIDLSVSSSTFNSLFLVWKLPATAHLGGEIRTYTWQYQRLQMAGMAAKTGNMTTQSTALTTSFTVPALSHASKFRVSVMICNKAGCGPPVSVEGNTQALG